MKNQKPESAPNKKRGPERSPRRQAAEEAGLSRSQMYRAMSVADVPEDEFERMVESDEPPTVTELTRIGRGQSEASEGRVTIPAQLWGPLCKLAEADGVSPHDVVRGLVADYLGRVED